ncbi:hypothetical protein RRG08_040111 [Elysia crispata]|uniref:Uncharacterized protein n=1 Tax=Elysia crispata TaxID=231223 RepID=A0AAE1CNE6_9GAST|nr:hypothetical protein RRG08_040111 [Elysia crispata]
MWKKNSILPLSFFHGSFAKRAGEQDQDRLCGSNPSFTHARRTGYTLSNKLLLRSTRTSNLIGPRGSIKLDQASGRQGQTATSRPMSCTLTVEVAGRGTLVGQTSTFVSSTGPHSSRQLIHNEHTSQSPKKSIPAEILSRAVIFQIKRGQVLVKLAISSFASFATRFFSGFAN